MNVAIYSFFISLALRMTVITAFVMLIKLIFRNKLSAAAHCAMWIILPIQTLFCVANIEIPSRASIYNAMPDVAIPAVTEAADVSAVYDFYNLIALIYLVGVVALALWYVSVYIIHCINVLKLEKISNQNIIERLTAIKAQLGINHDIVISKGKYTHMLANIVVLAEDSKEADIDQILTHELYHYKNKDNLKIWIGMAVLCINWFNPVIWLAFVRFKLNIEMYCDECVIKQSGKRKEYAKVLVKTANRNVRYVQGITSASNGLNEVSRRVRRIIAQKKQKPIWLITAILASVCIACLCLTDATTNVVTDTVPEINNTPEPVESVREMVESVIIPEEDKSTAVDMPTAKPHETSVPMINGQSGSVESMPNPIATPDSTVNITPSMPEAAETNKKEWGKKVSESANGSKETYLREDGSTVVLQYDEGELQAGYIIGGE